jgi:hypothetical protein
VSAITAERDRLNKVLEILTGDTALLLATAPKRRGRPKKSEMPDWVTSNGAAPKAEKPARKKRTYTAAERAAISKRFKAMWAEKRKAAKKAVKKTAKKADAATV